MPLASIVRLFFVLTNGLVLMEASIVICNTISPL